MVDKQLESWLNREINIMVDQVEKTERYQKRFLQGALHQAKKIQAKIIELRSQNNTSVKENDI